MQTKRLSPQPDYAAPDGSSVRLLAHGINGSMAHFELPPGQTSRAVTHRTVEELWYFLEGRGEMWRKQGSREEVTEVYPGVSVSIPAGAHFQFRALGETPLAAVAVTMPAWPGEDEAREVTGRWPATIDTS